MHTNAARAAQTAPRKKEAPAISGCGDVEKRLHTTPTWMSIVAPDGQALEIQKTPAARMAMNARAPLIQAAR